MIYAQLAMAIDCDGSLTSANGNPLIQVVNSSLVLMNWLKSNFGGEYYQDGNNKKRNANAKLIYHWQPCSDRRKEILEGILPFLVIKKQQALILLELLKMVRPRGLSFTQPLSLQEAVLRKRYSELLHALNS